MTGASADELEGAYAYCQTVLRDHDRDRYLADLFIPAEIRPHAHALHAFSFEIARVRDVVSEPMPGELRHQWWRDAIESRPLETREPGDRLRRLEHRGTPAAAWRAAWPCTSAAARPAARGWPSPC